MDAPHDPLDTPALLVAVAELAAGYVAEIGDRRVGPTAEQVGVLAEFDRALPDGPSSPLDVVRELHRVGSPATVGSTGPRYFGFVNGGVLPAALGASWLAGTWDQNVALSSMSPTATHLDQLALEWIVELLGLPEGAGGAFVTGATMASVSGLLGRPETQCSTMRAGTSMPTGSLAHRRSKSLLVPKRIRRY